MRCLLFIILHSLSWAICMSSCETTINYDPGNLAPATSFARGDGWQEENTNSNCEDITKNFLGDNKSWMVVGHKMFKKKNNKSDHWTKQKKRNFECFSDRW